MEIRFKSTPDNWKKEYSGLKRNTVRFFDDEFDVRKDILDKYRMGHLNIINVVIVNTSTEEEFTRTITDVTKFGVNYIISW